jgi:hypothetical protein
LAELREYSDPSRKELIGLKKSIEDESSPNPQISTKSQAPAFAEAASRRQAK